MELNLKGKTALVTGGSKGIGLAIKKALEKEGAKVYSLSRKEGFDIFNPEDGIDWREILNKCNILINNIGGGGTWRNPSLIFKKNYTSMELFTSWFLDYERKWGRVITISSIYGKEKGHNTHFTAAKAAQIAYMKTSAGKYPGITFNTICPGHIDVGKEFPDKPKVVGKPKDVAGIVTFLCSDMAKHINGACITVDGGESYSF